MRTGAVVVLMLTDGVPALSPYAFHASHSGGGNDGARAAPQILPRLRLLSSDRENPRERQGSAREPARRVAECGFQRHNGFHRSRGPTFATTGGTRTVKFASEQPGGEGLGCLIAVGGAGFLAPDAGCPITRAIAPGVVLQNLRTARITRMTAEAYVAPSGGGAGARRTG